MEGDEEPSLTLNDPAEGTIIVIDLDRFKEIVQEKGWDEYKPNIVTGTLTSLVEFFSRKWQGVIVFGLDPQRGTEEAIIEIPFINPLDVKNDLINIRDEINKLGVGVTIVAVRDIVIARPARNRREAYYGTPGRRRALKILRSIKRKGGNKVYIEGLTI
ncbi:MAG: hypothetical protein J7K21_07365 [Desulfurococcales archaeon]|nr:hypothetical protein [Desulfurococcales archaeon]